ncbi:MAG TPA: nitroreductase [Longimicrobiales bacterium]
MDVFDAIKARRSVKRFTDRPVPRGEIERLLQVATLAPNHRMTEPWGFRVLGAEAKRAYGRVLGRRKARRVEDAEAAQAVREKVLRETAAVPAIVAVTMRLDENPEIREEDYAATYMGIQNLLLAATAIGLGTHVKTGAVMDDPELRDALAVPSDRRVVALVHLGEAAEVPPPRPRTPATERTTWLP